MWQRIQTIFLIISVIAAIAFLFIPLAELEGDILFGKNDIACTAISIAIAMISLFSISQYKNRKLQMRLCRINMGLSVALFVVAMLSATRYSEYVHFEFAAGIPVVLLIALFFALRNIKKDEDLVRSMDRFR